MRLTSLIAMTLTSVVIAIPVLVFAQQPITAPAPAVADVTLADDRVAIPTGDAAMPDQPNRTMVSLDAGG